MAVRFNAAADRLLRVANLLDLDADYTFMCWLYIVNLPGVGVYDTLFTINEDNFVGGYDIFDVVNQAGNTRLLIATSAGYTETFGTVNLSNVTWYHTAIVRSANNSRIAYLNGVQDVNHITNISGRNAPTRNEIGGFGTGDVDTIDARVFAVKLWSAALSQIEVQQEINVIRPVRTANLHQWSPCFPDAGERARDYGGNGYNWTESGALTDEDPSAVSYGASSYFLGAVSVAAVRQPRYGFINYQVPAIM